MSFISDLHHTYDKNFKQILIDLNFELYETYAGEGMGALMKFKNDSLRLQLINDKGIINLDISSVNGKEDFRDTELIHSLINLEKINEKELSPLKRRQIVNQRLDTEQQARFIANNWDELVTYFNAKNIDSTTKKLNQIGLERSR